VLPARAVSDACGCAACSRKDRATTPAAEPRRSSSSAVPRIAGTLLPTLVASLGAAIAYCALAATQFRGSADFAVIGGTGMLACWIASFVLLPVLVLRFVHTPRRAPSRLFGGLVVRVFGTRRPVLACAIAGAVTQRGVAGRLQGWPYGFRGRRHRIRAVTASPRDPPSARRARMTRRRSYVPCGLAKYRVTCDGSMPPRRPNSRNTGPMKVLLPRGAKQKSPAGAFARCAKRTNVPPVALSAFPASDRNESSSATGVVQPVNPRITMIQSAVAQPCCSTK
jgi:hypothetical protein